MDLGNLAEPKKFFRSEYFDVIAGDGETKHQFNVIKENELLLNAPNTLVLTLTAPENYGVSEGQNVFYNNMIIGQIVSQKIDVNGVQFKAAIASEYRNLIHENTQFVAATNFDISVGLDGLRFESATPEKNGYKAAFECWQNKLWEKLKPVIRFIKISAMLNMASQEIFLRQR